MQMGIQATLFIFSSFAMSFTSCEAIHTFPLSDLGENTFTMSEGDMQETSAQSLQRTVMVSQKLCEEMPHVLRVTTYKHV